MGYKKKVPATIGGLKVSSLFPLVINIVGLFFYCTGVGATIYEDDSIKYNMWKYTNKTDSSVQTLTGALLPCGDMMTRINAGKIYYIAAVVFAVVNIIVNIFDICDRPIVTKGHGILTVATMFVGVIAWVISVSIMAHGVCDFMDAPMNNPGFIYGASQAVEILATILSFIAAIFIYAF